MAFNQHWLRVALRLQEAWSQAAELAGRQLPGSLERLEQQHRAWRRTRGQLELARRSGLSLVRPQLALQLQSRARELREACDWVLHQLVQPVSEMPSLRFLLDELRQIEADFGAVTIDWKDKAVCATTERITLERVYLGPFAIRFFGERLARTIDYLCFDVIALQPNPAVNNDDVTHPHVKCHHLCAGDATRPIKCALEEGRLADAFQLVRSVLLTYNAHSPYVALEDWEGRTCHDCECSVNRDDLHHCDCCDNDFCNDCVSACQACETSCCSGCLEPCRVCRSECCWSCLLTVGDVAGGVCPACYRRCARCRAVFVSGGDATTSRLCPACRPPSPSPPSPVNAVLAPGAFSDSQSLEASHATSLEPEGISQPVA